MEQLTIGWIKTPVVILDCQLPYYFSIYKMIVIYRIEQWSKYNGYLASLFNFPLKYYHNPFDGLAKFTIKT